MIKALALIVDEKEQLLTHEWSTERCAKHIPAQRRLRKALKIVRPVVSVQCVVSEELEEAAVIVVGSGLDGHTDDAALVIAELSGCVLGDEVKFLNGVDARGISDQIV